MSDTLKVIALIFAFSVCVLNGIGGSMSLDEGFYPNDRGPVIRD